MNILIKLTCLVGLVIAPILSDHSENGGHSQMEETQIEQVIEGTQLQARTED
jgi:K(+)-stimulated pyrophosphate-energized sodium pump